MSRVRRHRGAGIGVWTAGAVAAAAWWLLAGAGTAWYWRIAPAALLVAGLAGAVSTRAPLSRRRHRDDALAEAILASAPDAVVVVDDDGSVVEFNPAAERMFGVRRDTVMGAALHDGMLLPSATSERAPLDGSYEATATRSDGATFPAEVSTAPVVGVDARLRVLYVRDISERRRAQRAVYDLAAIIESSEDAIISKTLDGVIESWNAGAERLYGHTAAEAIGQRISLVEPLGRPTSRRPCWR